MRKKAVARSRRSLSLSLSLSSSSRECVSFKDSLARVRARESVGCVLSASSSNNAGDALVRVSYLKMLIEAEEEANLPGAHRRCRGSPFPLRAEDRYFQGPSFSDIVTFEGGSENDEALLEEGKSEKKTQRSARSPKRRAERQELRKMAPFGTGKDRYRRKASNSEEAVWPALCTDPGTAAFSRYTCSIA